MTDKQIKVGDVVPWVLCGTIPWGALFRHKSGWIGLRSEGRFRWVRMDDGEWKYEPRLWGTGGLMEDGARWDKMDGQATIIALDVPADATADDLRTLAEVYEVRENLLTLARWPDAPLSDDIYETIGQMAARREDWQTWLAKLLHRIGWRPGMTAEDAARMLAEADKRETLRRDSVLVTMLR